MLAKLELDYSFACKTKDETLIKLVVLVAISLVCVSYYFAMMQLSCVAKNFLIKRDVGKI